MEQLVTDVRAYAAAKGQKPQKVLRDAIGAGWGQWDTWVAGGASCTLRVEQRLRAYMAANPPAVAEPRGDAA